MRTSHSRWTQVVAWVFSAWYILGATTAFWAAFLWQARVSRAEYPPSGLLLDGYIAALVAALALLSSFRPGRQRPWLWWCAIGIGTASAATSVLHHGLTSDVLIELAVLLAATCAYVCLRERSKTP
jgi:hypothetical protein